MNVITTFKVIYAYIISRKNNYIYWVYYFGLIALFNINVTYAKMPDSQELRCPGCNVIFLNIELLRPEFIGLLGNRSLTPNVDKFFSKSIIFHDVTSPAGETFLSNTAVLTVTPTHRINVRPIIMEEFNKQDKEAQNKIKKELTAFTSVATILKNAGYKTISINQGRRAGKAVYLERGFDSFSQWSSDLLFEDMVDILNDRLAKEGDNKFFLLFRATYLHNHQYRRPVNLDIKIPVNAKQRYYRYKDRFGSQKEGVLLKRDRKQTKVMSRKVEREIYTGQVQYGDAVIERFFKLLSDDLLNNTIFVLYANHGTGLGDNDIYNHGTAYQSSVNVPLLIRLPGMEHAIHVRESVGLINLVPSILRMLDVKEKTYSYDETYDQVIAGKGGKDRVFYGKNGFDEFIRFNKWKYIVQYGRFERLYNLEIDPGETSNLLDKEPDIARKLGALLLQYKTRLLQN